MVDFGPENALKKQSNVNRTTKRETGRINLGRVKWIICGKCDIQKKFAPSIRTTRGALSKVDVRKSW
jgi:hypothetical protein